MGPWTEQTILTTDYRAPCPNIKELFHEINGQAGSKFLVCSAKEVCKVVCLFVLLMGNFIKCTEGNTLTWEKARRLHGSPLLNKSPTPSSTYQITICKGCTHHLHTYLTVVQNQDTKGISLATVRYVLRPKFPQLYNLFVSQTTYVQLLGYTSSNSVTEKQHTGVTSTQASLWGHHGAVRPGGWQHKNQFFHRFRSRRMTQRPTNARSKAEFGVNTLQQSKISP